MRCLPMELPCVRAELPGDVTERPTYVSCAHPMHSSAITEGTPFLKKSPFLLVTWCQQVEN